jgi:hypothetical protein
MDRVKAPDASKTASRVPFYATSGFSSHTALYAPGHRVSFRPKLRSTHSSRTPDQVALESPEGRGELLFKPGESANPVRSGRRRQQLWTPAFPDKQAESASACVPARAADLLPR